MRANILTETIFFGKRHLPCTVSLAVYCTVIADTAHSFTCIEQLCVKYVYIVILFYIYPCPYTRLALFYVCNVHCQNNNYMLR